MIEKLRNLSRETLIYGTNTIIARFLGFFLVPFYTNKFAPDDFGIVAILYSYIAILNVFFSIGLESGFMKFSSTMEIGTKKENFSNPYTLVFCNSLILSSVIFFFAPGLTEVFQVSINYSNLIRYSALILFFDSVVLIPFAFLRLAHHARTFASIKIANIVITVLLNIILIGVFNYGIEAVFISNLVASVVTFLLLMPVVMRNFAFGINKELIYEILKFSIPIIPAGIASNIIQTISRPILKYLTNDSVVGIYQANYRLGIIMMLFTGMFEFAWRPFFLNNAKEPDAKKIFSKVLTAFVIVGSLIFVITSVFIDDVVKINLPFKSHLIGKAYWSGLAIVPVILFSYLLYGIYINFMAGVYIEKKTKFLPLITGAGAITNIAMNFILIPTFSFMGAAAATFLSYLVMMSGMYFVSQKYYKVDYEIKKVLLILFLSVSITCLSMWLDNINWYLQILFPVGFIGMLYALGIIKKPFNVMKS